MNTTTSTYEQQAQAFLTLTGASLEIKFLRNGKHFDDDKDTRDIYQCTLSRGSRSYTFNFGQSIAHSGFYAVMGKKKIALDKSLMDKTDSEIKLHVKLKIDHDFGSVKADHIIRPHVPTAYDILACLTKYDPETFEDFCSEFGYDTDSRRAEKIYNAVCDEYKNLCALFSDDEMELLQEIQ